MKLDIRLQLIYNCVRLVQISHREHTYAISLLLPLLSCLGGHFEKRIEIGEEGRLSLRRLKSPH